MKSKRFCVGNTGGTLGKSLIGITIICMVIVSVFSVNAFAEDTYSPYICYSYNDGNKGDYLLLGKTAPSADDYAEVTDGTLFVHQRSNTADIGYAMNMENGKTYRVSGKIKMKYDVVASYDYISLVLRKPGETTNVKKQRLNYGALGLSTTEWKNFEFDYTSAETTAMGVYLEIGSGLRSNTMQKVDGQEVPIQYYLDDFRVTPIAEDENVVVNGGIEMPAAKASTGENGFWNCNTNGANTMTTVRVDKHSGSYSLCASNKTNGYGFNIFNYNKVKLKANRTYKMSYWAKRDATGAGTYYLTPGYTINFANTSYYRFLNTLFEADSKTSGKFDLTTEWKQYTSFIRFTTDTECLVGFMGNKEQKNWNSAAADKTATTVYVDDVRLEMVDNYVENGNFDSDISLWKKNTSGSIIEYNSIDKCVTFGGSQAQEGIKSEKSVPLEQEKTYTLTFRAKAADESSVGNIIRTRLERSYDSDDTKRDSVIVTYYPGLSLEWQEYKCQITPKTVDGYEYPSLIIDKAISDGVTLSAYIDDISIRLADDTPISVSGTVGEAMTARYSKDNVATTMYILSDDNGVILNTGVKENDTKTVLPAVSGSDTFALEAYMFDATGLYKDHKKLSVSDTDSYNLGITSLWGYKNERYDVTLNVENAIDEGGVIMVAKYTDEVLDDIDIFEADEFYGMFTKYQGTYEGNQTLKYFVWDSLTGLKPLVLDK